MLEVEKLEYNNLFSLLIFFFRRIYESEFLHVTLSRRVKLFVANKMFSFVSHLMKLVIENYALLQTLESTKNFKSMFLLHFSYFFFSLRVSHDLHFLTCCTKSLRQFGSCCCLFLLPLLIYHRVRIFRKPVHFDSLFVR